MLSGKFIFLYNYKDTFKTVGVRKGFKKNDIR